VSYGASDTSAQPTSPTKDALQQSSRQETSQEEQGSAEPESDSVIEDSDFDSSDWDSEAEHHDEDEDLYFSSNQREIMYQRVHGDVPERDVEEALASAFALNLTEGEAGKVVSRKQRSNADQVSSTGTSSTAPVTVPDGSSFGQNSQTNRASEEATAAETVGIADQRTKIFLSSSAARVYKPSRISGASWPIIIYRIFLGCMIAVYAICGMIYVREAPGRWLLAFSNLLTALIAGACLYLGALTFRAQSIRALIASTLANEDASGWAGGRQKLEKKFKYLITQALAAGILLAIWGCFAEQSAIEDFMVAPHTHEVEGQTLQGTHFIHDPENLSNLREDLQTNPLARILAGELDLGLSLDADADALAQNPDVARSKAAEYAEHLTSLLTKSKKTEGAETVIVIPFWIKTLWRLAGTFVHLLIPSCVAICCCYVAVLRVRVRSASRAISVDTCTVDYAQKRLEDIENIVEHFSNYIGSPLAVVLGLITARFVTLTLYIMTESPSRYVENSILMRPSIMFNLIALPALVMAAVLTSVGGLKAECDFLLQVVNRFYVLHSSLGGDRSAKAEHLLEYSVTATLQPTLGGTWSPEPESAITALFAAIMFYATMLKWKYRQFL